MARTPVRLKAGDGWGGRGRWGADRRLGTPAERDPGRAVGIIGRVSSVYRDKPWLARYRAGQPDSITAPIHGRTAVSGTPPPYH
jgi:hypothetical protein